jgi:hypothetical protein
VNREREALRGKIEARQSHTPIDELIGRINRHLSGWANYYQLAYPRHAYRQINTYVRQRLRRRSQRGWHAPQGVSPYAHLGLVGL